MKDGTREDYEFLAEAERPQQARPEPRPTVGELNLDDHEMSLDELARSFGLGEINIES